MIAMNPRDSGLHCFRRLPEQLWTLRKQKAGDVQICFPVPRRPVRCSVSTQTNLGEYPLSGQEFSAQSNDKTHHCETAIPLFSECRKTEFCVVHGICCERIQLWQIVEGCCEKGEPVLGADLTTWFLACLEGLTPTPFFSGHSRLQRSRETDTLPCFGRTCLSAKLSIGLMWVWIGQLRFCLSHIQRQRLGFPDHVLEWCCWEDLIFLDFFVCQFQKTRRSFFSWIILPIGIDWLLVQAQFAWPLFW